MKNPQLSLRSRLQIRLLTDPACLDMTEVSRATGRGTTFCLAGLILNESGVKMAYSKKGVALGLADGEIPPSEKWVDYERLTVRRRTSGLVSRRPISRKRVPGLLLLAAKARELWAASYGDDAAKLLPFYGPDWEVGQRGLGKVKAKQVAELLEVVNEVAAYLSAIAA